MGPSSLCFYSPSSGPSAQSNLRILFIIYLREDLAFYKEWCPSISTSSQGLDAGVFPLNVMLYNKQMLRGVRGGGGEEMEFGAHIYLIQYILKKLKQICIFKAIVPILESLIIMII